MRIRSRFLLVGLSILLLPLGAKAQDSAPVPEPAPLPSATPGSYPDIDALREPGSSAKFLASPSPSPSSTTPGQGIHAGNVPSNGALFGGGQHNRSVRANDQILAQVDGDPLEVRVAYRRDKTVAMVRDPGLAVLLHQAAAAGTEIQKRAFLKEYYTRLYAEIRQVDPSPEMKSSRRPAGPEGYQAALRSATPDRRRRRGHRPRWWWRPARTGAVITRFPFLRMVKKSLAGRQFLKHRRRGNRRYRLVVRSRPSQGWSTGSNPVSATTLLLA